MKKSCVVIFLFCCSSAFAQVNTTLSKLVDSLAAEDHRCRELLAKVENNEIDIFTTSEATAKMLATDSLNFLIIKKLFDENGYLGYDKVSKASSNNFWLLVLHADKHPEFQNNVSVKMKAEADKGKASFPNYAYLVDRVKINTNQPQIYGTELRLNAAGTSYEPKPVIEPQKLNERRMQVALPSIEEYIKTTNARYGGNLKAQ